MIRSFKYEWLFLFPWLCYSSNEDASYGLTCVLFSLDFSTKASLVIKIYFHSPSGPGQVLFLTLELIVKGNRKKLILDMNLHKALISQHDLNLELFFLKSKAQVMKIICCLTENINMRLKKTVNY